MKCIHCTKDCKHSERKERKCPHCHHPFAFEPRNGDPFTDGVMQSAIDAASSRGALKFGVDHVYYEVCRRLRRRSPSLIVGLLALSFFAGIALFALPSPWCWLAPPLVIGIGLTILLAVRARSTVAMHRGTFERLWLRWCRTHGTPLALIVRKEPRLHLKAVEADVGDYSFDRAVICDRAETVDLLLANQFHFENNCAILSIDGYPPGPFAMVREMLQRNPHLQVFVLHDATPEGCRLAHRLRTDPEWFKGRAQVIDVGLRPSHADAFKGLWKDSDRDVKPGNGITTKEAEWLSAYHLALAAVRPEQVLKRLFRAISHRFDPHAESKDSSSGGGTSDGGGADDTSFSDNAGDGDGGADAFG